MMKNILLDAPVDAVILFVLAVGLSGVLLAVYPHSWKAVVVIWLITLSRIAWTLWQQRQGNGSE
jgi:hypothetical protein